MWQLLFVARLITSSQCTEVIVSMYKPAYQIDAFDHRTGAEKAVDNDFRTDNVNCAISNTSLGWKWWLIDLRSTFSVKKVKIHARPFIRKYQWH